MIKEIASDVHWFTLFVLVNILCILMCVTLGVVHLFSCVGLVLAASVFTYRLLLLVAERQRPVSSSAITDILNQLNILTTTTVTKEPSVKTLHSAGYECDPSVFEEQRGKGCFAGGLMFQVDVCVQYVMRDFVVSWYRNLSTNERFICEVQYALEDLSIALVSRARKLGIHLLLRRAFCVYHKYFLSYLDALNEVRRTYRRPTLESCLSSTDAVQGCFAEWHFALSSPTTEMVHLHNVVNVLLEVMVPADVLCCNLGRKLVVTLLVHKVLHPLVDLLSDPHWLNQKMIALMADPKRIAAMKMDVPCRTDNTTSFSGSTDIQDSGLFLEGLSFSVGTEEHRDSPKGFLSVGDSLESRDSLAKLGTSTVGAISRSGDGDAKDKSTSKEVSPEDATEGIWQRMAGELPAAFRSERDQEVNVMVQEASVGLEKKRTLRLPLSGSLERISDMFSSTISFECISNNLAQYFKLAVDESKPCSTSQSLGDGRTYLSSENVDSVKDASSSDNSIRTTLSKSAIEDGGEIPNYDYHVSSVLERVLPMTTGPVLSEQLCNIGYKAAVNEDKRFTVTVPMSNSIESGPFNSQDSECYVLETQKHTSLKFSFESNKSGDSLEDDSDIKTSTPELSRLDNDLGNISPLGSTFVNIVIAGTEIINENHSGSHYVIYCIQYDAWYHDPNLIKVVDVDHYVDILAPRTILQKNCVRRRFREFVTLHTRLEEDSKLRPVMKGIKGPNKWSVLPFSKLDKETIAERRQFLENYLQILVSKEEIASCNHLREFLAYGNDPSIAYVRKVTDIGLPVPRIDKLLMRTVTGVFDKLKTALPSLPHDPSPIEPTNQLQKTSDRLLGFLNFNSALNDETSLPLSFDFTSDTDFSRCLEEQLGHFLGNYDGNYDKVDAAYEAGELDTWMKDPWSSLDGKPTGTQESGNVTANRTAFHKEIITSVDSNECLDNEIPLASAILNFIVETVQNEHIKVNKERFVHVTKLILGPLLERWVIHLIDSYSSEEMFAKYLKMIREVVWPNGILLSQATTSPNDFDKRRTYDTAFQALKEYFPSLIILLLGRAQYESGMKLFLDSLQHPKLLRHLIYQLLDLLVDVLLVRSRSQSIIEKLGLLS